MYRNYGTTRQGMFVPARTWLPARDKLAEADMSKEVVVRPGGTATFDSAHYHVIYDRGQFSAAEISAIAQSREAALAKAVAAIGPTPAGFRILLYLYKDDQDKQEATGVGDMTHTIAADREIHATPAYARSSSAREEIHVLARDTYGPSYLTSIHEGLALSVENSFRGQDMETHAGRLRAANKLPRLGDIVDEESFRILPPEIATATAGAFMTWLRQTYGPAGVKKSYGLNEGTTAALAEALGTTSEALSASFLSWADAKAAVARNQLDFDAAQAEAQQKQAAHDWAGMTTALRKALKFKPGEPQTLFNLASAQMRAGDLAGAEASLKQILAAPVAPDGSHFRIFGHFQLGRVYDLAGRRAEALAEYDAVLALPDEHGAHALAMERKAKPATRDQLQ
jgi:hypothetical protein